MKVRISFRVHPMLATLVGRPFDKQGITGTDTNVKGDSGCQTQAKIAR